MSRPDLDPAVTDAWRALHARRLRDMQALAPGRHSDELDIDYADAGEAFDAADWLGIWRAVAWAAIGSVVLLTIATVGLGAWSLFR